jgi:hypothetical protein
MSEELERPSNNALAAKRDRYIELLGEAYADSYGNWLAKQTEERRARIQRKSNNVKNGLATVAPITCAGPKKCPFYTRCPIPDEPGKEGPASDYPINMPCVLEAEYTAQKMVDYIDHLKVDVTDPVEMSFVNELALLDLLRNRAVMIMSGGDSRGYGRDMLTTDEAIVGWDDNGVPLTSVSTKIHPAVEIMDKHERRRQKILDKMVATRESKIKLYGGNLDNNTRLQDDIRALRQMVQAVASGRQLAEAPVVAIGLDDLEIPETRGHDDKITID